jgi:hypothetical protein
VGGKSGRIVLHDRAAVWLEHAVERDLSAFREEARSNRSSGFPLARGRPGFVLICLFEILVFAIRIRERIERGER